MRCTNPWCYGGIVGVLVDLGTPVYCDECWGVSAVLNGLEQDQLYGVFDDYVMNQTATHLLVDVVNA